MHTTTLAESMYEAYNAGGDPATANKNFQGNPCPAWGDLPQNVRAKWEAAATLAESGSSFTSAGVDFGHAIAALKAGHRVRRTGWNGKGMWLALQSPDEHSKMGHPYVYMSDVAGKLFPWSPNALDMLATDWEVVK